MSNSRVPLSVPVLLRRYRTLLLVAADMALISLAIYLAFLLRFDAQIPAQYFTNILSVTLLALALVPSTLYFFRLYSFSWTYISTKELVSLAKALSLSFLLLGASLFVLRDAAFFSGFPRSTIFISFVLVFLFCGGTRFAKRLYLEIGRRGREEKERTLIVGAGDAGEQILRSILVSRETAYLPVCFVDDNPAKQGILIHGVEVLGKIDDIPKVIAQQRIQGMIIAVPSAGSRLVRRAVELGREAGLRRIKVVPSLTEIIDGQVTVGNLRQVEVEDLLGREPVYLDTELIGDFVRSKVILVTGAAGSIGSELSRQIARFSPSRLCLLDRDETGIFDISAELRYKWPRLDISPLVADILDEKRIERIFGEVAPQVVLHAAAYKHVPLMEINPAEAVKNNIFGTKTVAQVALKCGVGEFIFVSTDKAVKPTSVMGATKRVGEMICQLLNTISQESGEGRTRFISVRFGNVLNSRGSVIPIFREQIRRGGPVEITHPEMKRYFMTTSEACLLVLQAGALGQGGEVFVLDMGEPIKILDLARDMIRLSGLEPDRDVPIVFTGPRPGEKIFEEILTAEEGTVATKSEKVFMARLSPLDHSRLDSRLERLREAAVAGEEETMIEILRQLVPSYEPTNHP